MTLKKDIEGIEDIKLLVDEFYRLVRQDKILGPVFKERLEGHWEAHLEKMYLFWNAALFGVKGYVGNPFAKHANMPVEGAHFERWLLLFNSTVEAYFEGAVATDARRRAFIMATTFNNRIDDLKGTDRISLV